MSQLEPTPYDTILLEQVLIVLIGLRVHVNLRGKSNTCNTVLVYEYEHESTCTFYTERPSN